MTTKKAGIPCDGFDHLMRSAFWKSSIPTKIRSGDVAVVGTWLNIGVKNVETANNIPQNRTLSPDFAPDLMAAALSGEIRMGGPQK